MNYGAASGIDYEATPASYDPVAVGHQSPVDIARIDPTRALEAAQNHLRLVSAPEIQNAMQARGMGNSGAEAEAMALAGARMVLPIEEQILGSEHEVNMMEGQILARQQEVELLEQQKAALQSQALTAQSYDQAQAINAQLAQVEAQLNTALAQTEYTGQIQASIAQRNAEMGFGSQLLGQTAGLMDTEFSGQTQQAIAQRNAELGYSQGILGTAANLMGTQYQGRTATGNQILNNTMQAGLSLPGMRSQWYNDRMTGAEADFQAASVPQQMAMQDYINKQNFYQSMVGAVPSGNLGFPGATNSSNNGPQWGQITNALGNAALIGSMYMDKS
jgi:hypothetical protein